VQQIAGSCREDTHCHHSRNLGDSVRATYRQAPGILCIHFGGEVRVPQQRQTKTFHHLAQKIVSLKFRQYLKARGGGGEVQSGACAEIWDCDVITLLCLVKY
jgi:hypothetical protein